MAAPDHARKLDACVRQREAVAELGRRAATGTETKGDFDRLLTDAVAAVRDAMGADSCAILEAISEREELSVRADVGRSVGETETVPASRECHLGYALEVDEPVVVENLEAESRFRESTLLAGDAVSGITVTVGSDADDDPWGVLSVHAAEERTYSDADVGFLEDVASLVAAVADERRSRRDESRASERENGSENEREYDTEREHRIRIDRESERKREQLERERRKTNRTLQRLYAISSDPEASFEEKVDRVLQLGREYLGVGIGFVAAIDEDEDRFEVLRARSESDLIRTGIVTSLSRTYCRRTIENDGLLALCNAGEEGWADDPAYEKYDFECYLGGKVIVDDELYGTLCFCDSNAHDEFTRAERTLVELITQWVSYELERVERERALTKYETIVETVNDGIYTVDEDGRFTMVNEAYTDLVGYSRDELLGEHVSLVADEDTVHRAIRVQEALVEGTVEEATSEGQLRTKNDNRVLVEGTFAMLPDDGDREPEGERDHNRERVGVVRDITERRARERRLEESERRYRTLVEHFPNGAVGLFDEELRFTVVGGQLLEDLGIEPDDPVGSTVFDWLPADVLERIEPSVRGTLEGERDTVELAARGRNLLVHAVPVRNAADEVFAGMVMVQDVTRRKEYQRKLEETVAKFEESNERLEQFAYAASHDLQEPLRMVSSYLQLIDRRYGDELDEDGREFLAYAVDGAERMREMINGLLAYSRIDTRGNPLEPLDLEGVVEDALADLEVRIEESDAAVTVEPLPRVRGDAGQLRQVFQNLVSNAVTYSGDEPPQIRISAERRLTKASTSTNASSPDECEYEWVVSVRDEGIGIDSADTERIFEVFNRLHSIEEYPGTGLGLALCQRIVERHGGEIWVESEAGDGTTFSFTLPGAGERAVDGDDENE